MQLPLTRIAALCAFGAVAFWIVGVVLLDSGSPGENATAADELAYITQEGTSIVFGAMFLGIGSILFAVMLTGLRGRFPAGDRWTPLWYVTGILTVLLVFLTSTPAVSGWIDEDRKLEPAAAQALTTLGDGFFIGAEFMAVAFLLGIGIAALTTGALPRWLAWVSLVFAAIALVPWVGWAVVVWGIPLWTIVVGVLLLRSPRDEPVAAPA